MRPVVITAVLLSLSSAAAFGAAIVAAPYSGSYTITQDFIDGTDFNVIANLGGVAFLNNSTLLLGGSANGNTGAIYSLPVTRDAGNHIIGLGAATLFSSGPFNDGGLAFGPGGDLFLTEYPVNSIGEIKPGSVAPDLTVDLNSTVPAVCSSVGSLGFVPGGFAGAGEMKVVSYNCGQWYDAALTPTGTGTYNIAITDTGVNTGRGPEGVVWIGAGNPDFGVDSALVSEYATGTVSTYTLDADGNPVPGSRQDFITGLSGAEGAAIDPLTGDFLFSTYGGGSQLVVVSGFNAPPPAVPEPGTLAFLGLGVGFMGLKLRRSTSKR